MSDLFSVCDEHDWANQKAGLKCPHCRIDELEAEIKRKDRARRSLLVMFEKLREEHEQMQEALKRRAQQLADRLNEHPAMQGKAKAEDQWPWRLAEGE
jgi:hypothetical protein